MKTSRFYERVVGRFSLLRIRIFAGVVRNILRNTTYSALLAATCLFIALVGSAFLVVSETTATRFARASRELSRSTVGTFRIDFQEKLPGQTLEGLLQRIESSAQASEFEYMVRTITYADVLIGEKSARIPVVGVRGSLPPGKGWKPLGKRELFVTEGVIRGSGVKVGWKTAEVLVNDAYFKVVGALQDAVPLYPPELDEGVLSFDLQGWNEYVVIGMDDWVSLFGTQDVVQVVIRDRENQNLDPLSHPEKNQLYSTLSALEDSSFRGEIQRGELQVQRWYLPNPANANLFRLIGYSLSSIAIVSGAVAVFSCANSIALLRSREIAVMRAIGADLGQVRRLLLGEVTFLALIGGVPGTIIGTAISLLILESLQMQTTMGIIIVQSVAAFLVCLAVTVFSSSLSLFRIGKKRPAEVLRWSGGFALR